MIQIKIMLIFIINYSKDISKKVTNENALIDTAMEDDNVIMGDLFTDFAFDLKSHKSKNPSSLTKT